jgi:hypothetical protein
VGNAPPAHGRPYLVVAGVAGDQGFEEPPGIEHEDRAQAGIHLGGGKYRGEMEEKAPGVDMGEHRVRHHGLFRVVDHGEIHGLQSVALAQDERGFLKYEDVSDAERLAGKIVHDQKPLSGPLPRDGAGAGHAPPENAERALGVSLQRARRRLVSQIFVGRAHLSAGAALYARG